MKTKRFTTNKFGIKVLATWTQRKCKRCQRFLSDLQNRFCERCSKLEYKNYNKNNHREFYSKNLNREIQRLRCKIFRNVDRFNVGDYI